MSFLKIMVDRSKKRASSVGANDSNKLIFKKNSFHDDYTNKKEIGEGMNGKVFLCESKIDHKNYAVKKLKDNPISRREIKLQWRASLNSNHIVKIKNVYKNGHFGRTYLYLVTEYMEGGQLFDRLKEHTSFSENDVAKIMVQICKAVNHLHSMGIAHRDLKLENLLLKSKNSIFIKLSDFGFAKEASKDLKTSNFSPYYVPPEILSQNKYDISCDIWSLGVVMYILCCGYPPFYSAKKNDPLLSPGMKTRILKGKFAFPESDWLNVSDEAKQLIARMITTVPENRPTIQEILKSSWMKNYANASKAPLNSINVLKKEKDSWPEHVRSINQALEEMRFKNDDQTICLKPLEVSNNELYKRRCEKNKLCIKRLAKQTVSKTVETNPQNSFKRFLSLPNPNSFVVPFNPLPSLKYIDDSDADIYSHNSRK